MIYINIGSNINSIYGDRFKNIQKAIFFLKKKKINIEKISDYYETPSYPNKLDPKFINIALKINTRMNFDSLIVEIKLIEKKMGRVKTIRNGPRTCDIDIIDFKHMVIKKKLVILPHPRLHLRNFVLYPLKEIEPNWSHPVLNKSIDNLLSELSHFSRMEITRLNKSDINSK